MKLLSPLLPARTEAVEINTEMLQQYQQNEERVQGCICSDLFCEAADFSHMVFSGIRFENCRFWNCTFTRTEFRDVLFRTCDISGCDFSDSFMERVSLSMCKGIGAKFTGSVNRHLLIHECNLNYANFDSSRFENIRIEQTKLENSNISQCRCKCVEWSHANLTGTSFFGTALHGMDFSDSVIPGLLLSDDNRELKGAVVDLYQAAELAKRLGITIKDIEV